MIVVLGDHIPATVNTTVITCKCVELHFYMCAIIQHGSSSLAQAWLYLATSHSPGWHADVPCQVMWSGGGWKRPLRVWQSHLLSASWAEERQPVSASASRSFPVRGHPDLAGRCPVAPLRPLLSSRLVPPLQSFHSPTAAAARASCLAPPNWSALTLTRSSLLSASLPEQAFSRPSDPTHGWAIR